MLHNQSAVLSVRPWRAANKQQRHPFKRINKTLRRKKKVEQQMGQGYQTAHIAYANWLQAVFGFLGATADKVRVADATALAGFLRIELIQGCGG
jgi:hypothetical protein